MEEKYILVPLDDERTQELASVLGNKTCKKILNLLIEKAASETEIAKSLSLPLNTIDYNIKKLIKVGLIEEKKHLWSSRGKRVPFYKVSNKLIIISPKKTYLSRLKSTLPIIIISSIFTAFILWYFKARSFIQSPITKTEETLIIGAREIGYFPNIFIKNLIVWFLSTMWIIIILYILLNLKSNRR